MILIGSVIAAGGQYNVMERVDLMFWVVKYGMVMTLLTFQTLL